MFFPPAPSLQECIRARQAELERMERALAWGRRHPFLHALRWRLRRLWRIVRRTE